MSDQARDLDKRDDLASWRTEFAWPQALDDKPYIYLCGHSLGLQPRRAVAYVQDELQKWARQGVLGHTHEPHPWIPYHEPFAELLCPLIGADSPSEVVVMNSLTVNLHLLLQSFYDPTAKRRKVLMDQSSFPSDRYALRSHMLARGGDPADLIAAPCEPEALQEYLRQHAADLQLIVLPGVHYLDGRVLPMAEICRFAKQHEITVGLDLAHAVGNVKLQLHAWGVDFAVWCHYKYMNGGPGTVGGAFVHAKHHAHNLARFAGWWGHDKASRFSMPDHFKAISGAEGWQLSNPPILSLAPLRAALEIFTEAGFAALRAKSQRLVGFFRELCEARLSDHVEVVTPTSPTSFGNQLSLRLKHKKLASADIFWQRGVLVDFRVPDILRAGFAPLYVSFSDVEGFVDVLEEVCHGSQ